jgi:glycosyltransferase involved in cell wall biosynthesis
VYHISEKVWEIMMHVNGVDYVGSVSQTKLSKELIKTSILSYPNTFPETSCIAVMEAMAAGCFVVTSNLGALPETLAGFGAMVDIDGDWQKYGNFFIREILNFLYNPQDMSKQIEYVNKNYVWSLRAKEWEKWMKTLK